MAHLIDKSALVAEIELELRSLINATGDYAEGRRMALVNMRGFINTLEVKELLTWQDIRLISEIGEKFMNSEESDHLSEEKYYTEIFNRFKAYKGEEM